MGLATWTILSFAGEWISNSKPVYLQWNNRQYFPILVNYHPSEFDQTETLVTDYRRLDSGKVQKILWPLNRWDPFEQNTLVEAYPSPPSSENWLGTDDRGRDIFARLLYGLRYSMGYAVLVWIFSVSLGSFLGGGMGYFGGWTDIVGQRVVEVLSTVPQFFLLIIIVSIFQPNLFWLVVLSSFFGWIPFSYYVRGEFLKLRKMEFIEAAKSIGASHLRILARHILPNGLGSVVSYSPFFIATSVVSLTALDFLGFGLPPPTPSWGELLNQAQKHFTTAWWLALFPSLALFASLVLLSLIGEAVREAFDPRKAPT